MEYFTKFDDNVLICEVCPRRCQLRKGQSGFCHIRVNSGNKIEFLSYGHITGLAIDPIEKKPLFHFFPSTEILSLGTYGCNMGCKFCQNFTTTKTKLNPFDLPFVAPIDVVRAARDNNCKSIAFTYNDPVVFFEYALDVARLAKNVGIKTVAVSAGYAQSEIRKRLFSNMDAVNIDLKAFSDDFYRKNCAAKLDVVLDTLIYIKHETSAWLEITTLLIEGENDSEAEIFKMCEWIVNNLGKNTPLHFSAFHPAYKMLNKPRTSFETLKRAYTIAKDCGISYVYLGNVRDILTSSTYCKKCGALLVERDWFKVTKYNLDEFARCKNCHTLCDGFFI